MKKKKIRQLHMLVTVLIRAVYFFAFPAAWSTGFSGVKYLFTQIHSGKPIELTAFLKVLIALVLYTVVFGRFFCGKACAFGTYGDVLYEISSRIAEKLKRKPPRLPEHAGDVLRFLKYAVLLAVCLLCVFGTVIPAKLGKVEYAVDKYGAGAINVYPDDTVAGYTWNEYLDSIYAATISDGTATAGAVYWIDLYGERATAGYHYNKVEFELNNGLTKADNAQNVSRYAVFYNEDGTLKAGKYTVNVYAEGYDTVTAEIEIGIALADKKAVYTGEAVSIDEAVVSGVAAEAVTYTYYSDEACTAALEGPPTEIGTYYVKAAVADLCDKAKLEITKKANKITKIAPLSKNLKAKNLKKKKASFKLKATVKNKASVTFAAAKYLGKAKKYVSVTKAGKVTVKKGTPKGTYKVKVKATSKETAAVKSANLTKTVMIKVK